MRPTPEFLANTTLVEFIEDEGTIFSRQSFYKKISSTGIDLSNATNFLVLPNGNTAQRGSTYSSRIRFNTELDRYEVTKNGAWCEIGLLGAETNDSTFLPLPNSNSIANAPVGSLRANSDSLEFRTADGWYVVNRPPQPKYANAVSILISNAITNAMSQYVTFSNARVSEIVVSANCVLFEPDTFEAGDSFVLIVKQSDIRYRFEANAAYVFDKSLDAVFSANTSIIRFETDGEFLYGTISGFPPQE